MAYHTPVSIWDDTWKSNFYVSYGVAHKTIKHYYKNVYGIDVGAKERENGFCLEIESKIDHAIIVWTKEQNPAILAHECFHAAVICMHSKGVEFELGGKNEPYAYLIGRLMRETLDRTRKR